MTSSFEDDFGFRDQIINTKSKNSKSNVTKDLDELEDLVLTFFENIKSVPDKNGTLTIKWPSRVSDIDDNITKVKDILSRIRKNT